MAKFPVVYICVVVGAVLSFAYVNLMSNMNNASKWHSFFEKKPAIRQFNSSSLGSAFDKWIVVTTIFSPTDDVKFLAKIPGWKVVVVADRKTPRHWSSPNCIFLDLETQQQLGFESVALLPTGSYARKTIGYLYAIARGAKVIYETDDDNRPLDLLRNFILQPQTSGIMFDGEHLFNPYRHFGQPTLWPRGYPLNAIGDNVSYNYILQTWKSPSIQQGLVNGDPDMDAIFRLTRKKTLTMLNVTFDMRAPPGVVPAGVFSPFNSQNTLFLYDALWALLIPTTTTFRVCDIWRGYWAQRLLWEMGGTLGFLPPNAFQKRNSHSYLDDAVQEKDLYFETTRLLLFLKQWNCHPKATFFTCVLTLSQDMANNNFWKQADVLLTETWLRDLKMVGYREPERVQAKYQNGSFCPPKGYSDRQTVVEFWPVEQKLPIAHTTKDTYDSKWNHVRSISSFCSETSLKLPKYALHQTSSTYSNILLIIVFNFAHYENVKLLEIIYSMHFPQRLYCGPGLSNFRDVTRPLKTHVTFIEVDIGKGYFGYACMMKAMSMNYHVDGYLHVADDTLMNVWNLNSLPVDRIWVSSLLELLRTSGKSTNWVWRNSEFGKKAYLSSMSEFKQVDKSRYNAFKQTLNANTKLSDGFYHQPSDIVYIPTRLKEHFIFINRIFVRHRLFLEMAFPTFIAGVEYINKLVFLKGKYLWYDGSRKYAEKRFNKDVHFLHPVKIKQVLNATNGVKFFCEIYLPLTLPGVKI
ncbi:probable glycosyltransferase STELLO1 isoform X1 [Gigantopelta aegis]|uniref:probable glycosyltransferase STELLO1 isoform X1 n=1 Tax=Gigantopelta aegis TaxID=1735272 RepID=UPI001B88A541|nr:probable glycosyltransferase STELLO1 isoform X1 [Gigantopelta aegis]